MAPVAEIDRRKLYDLYRRQLEENVLREHRLQIERDLRALGAVTYDMLLPETHILPLIIQPGERIIGITYGRYKQYIDDREVVGRGALVLTARRILLVDKKPFAVRCDQMPYDSLSSITHGQIGFITTITLHTRMGDIDLRTFNTACAHSFIATVEEQLMQRAEKEGGDDYSTPKRLLQTHRNKATYQNTLPR